MILPTVVTLMLGASLIVGSLLGNVLVPHQTNDVRTSYFPRAEQPFINPNQEIMP